MKNSYVFVCVAPDHIWICHNRSMALECLPCVFFSRTIFSPLSKLSQRHRAHDTKNGAIVKWHTHTYCHCFIVNMAGCDSDTSSNLNITISYLKALWVRHAHCVCLHISLWTTKPLLYVIINGVWIRCMLMVPRGSMLNGFICWDKCKTA